MNVTVQICTWNNNIRLAKTLDSFLNIKSETDINWELVIVNNNCTDKTDDAVKKYDTFLPINYIYEHNQGISYARNTGLEASKGDLIIFTDDDVIPYKGYIQSYWDVYIKYQDKYFFGGPVKSLYESNDFDKELIKWGPASVRGLDFGPELKILDDEAPFLGANWACPAIKIKELSGFNTKLGQNPSLGQIRVGEETDMMYRLKNNGMKGVYIPKAGIKHFVPKEKCTLAHLSSRAKAYGFYMAMYEEEKFIKGRNICGIPIWLCKYLIVDYSIWQLKRLFGKKDYRNYALFCKNLGRLKYILSQKR